MAQSYTTGVNLGAGLAGQAANIRAQLRGTNGATVGGLVSTGFTEVGTKGTYAWHYAAYPDGFEGTVEFSISGTVWSIIGINNADFGVTTDATAEEIADAVWAHDPRTLTSSAAQTAAELEGDDLALLRGDTWDQAFTGLGNITGRTKLWFTAKVSEQDLDTAAIIQIEEGAGLLYLNGAAPVSAADGSITVTNATTGALTIHLEEARTAELVPATGLWYDIQWRSSGGDTRTIVSGRLTVARDVTRVTS